MSKRFNLSEFVGESEHPYHISTIPTEKVKEFIRLLKEMFTPLEFPDRDEYSQGQESIKERLIEAIDELMGEKLK